jgi:hypothetical protein
LNKKCIFEHCREFQARKTLFIDIIFATKNISADLFRAAPYMFMSVLHKDVLFHSNSKGSNTAPDNQRYKMLGNFGKKNNSDKI